MVHMFPINDTKKPLEYSSGSDAWLLIASSNVFSFCLKSSFWENDAEVLKLRSEVERDGSSESSDKTFKSRAKKQWHLQQYISFSCVCSFLSSK